MDVMGLIGCCVVGVQKTVLSCGLFENVARSRVDALRGTCTLRFRYLLQHRLILDLLQVLIAS